jgi:hypothetical protein
MTLTVLLVLGTIVLATVSAVYAARACRGAHDVARALGASGANIRQIARRTGLQQDIVAMLLAGRPARRPAPRQNVPLSAGTARSGTRGPGRTQGTSSRAPDIGPSSPRAKPGTDVALA